MSNVYPRCSHHNARDFQSCAAAMPPAPGIAQPEDRRAAAPQTPNRIRARSLMPLHLPAGVRVRAAQRPDRCSQAWVDLGIPRPQRPTRRAAVSCGHIWETLPAARTRPLYPRKVGNARERQVCAAIVRASRRHRARALGCLREQTHASRRWAHGVVEHEGSEGQRYVASGGACRGAALWAMGTRRPAWAAIWPMPAVFRPGLHAAPLAHAMHAVHARARPRPVRLAAENTSRRHAHGGAVPDPMGAGSGAVGNVRQDACQRVREVRRARAARLHAVLFSACCASMGSACPPADPLVRGASTLSWCGRVR